MTTTAENNIRAMEMLLEDLRIELNAAIDEYELALEYPEYYDLELAKKEMDKHQRWYDEQKADIEWEKALLRL